MSQVMLVSLLTNGGIGRCGFTSVSNTAKLPMSRIPSASPEVGVIRTYVDWLISLPWNVTTDDRYDIKEAAKILDEDHYGLEAAPLPEPETAMRHVFGDDSRCPGKAADVSDQIDDVGRTCREVVERASCKKSFFRLGVNSARHLHGSSRVIGQVMQWGPPPPRTSSPPSNVIAARWCGGISMLSDRKSDAVIILKPAFSSSLNVVSFRA